VRLEGLLLAKFSLLCFEMLRETDYNFFFALQPMLNGIFCKARNLFLKMLDSATESASAQEDTIAFFKDSTSSSLNISFFAFNLLLPLQLVD